MWYSLLSQSPRRLITFSLDFAGSRAAFLCLLIELSFCIFIAIYWHEFHVILHFFHILLICIAHRLWLFFFCYCCCFYFCCILFTSCPSRWRYMFGWKNGVTPASWMENQLPDAVSTFNIFRPLNLPDFSCVQQKHWTTELAGWKRQWHHQ